MTNYQNSLFLQFFFKKKFLVVNTITVTGSLNSGMDSVSMILESNHDTYNEFEKRKK